jgi:hypothetical protein
VLRFSAAHRQQAGPKFLTDGRYDLRIPYHAP